LKYLADWAPEVVRLLHQAGYFDLPEGTAKEQIARKIGLHPGGDLYKRVLASSIDKNEPIWRILLDEQALRDFKAGAREVAADLNIPFSKYDWNDLAQPYFEKHGLEFVKNMTATDLQSLRQRIQYDFGLNPKAFGQKFAKSYACSPYRLERIKRTETHTCAQAGGFGFAKEVEAEFKQWLCHPRGKWPRPSHRAVWYEIQPIDEPFSIGQMWPSDVNCRCYLIYFIDQLHLERSQHKP